MVEMVAILIAQAGMTQYHVSTTPTGHYAAVEFTDCTRAERFARFLTRQGIALFHGVGDSVVQVSESSVSTV